MKKKVRMVLSGSKLMEVKFHKEHNGCSLSDSMIAVGKGYDNNDPVTIETDLSLEDLERISDHEVELDLTSLRREKRLNNLLGEEPKEEESKFKKILKILRNG